MKTSTISLLILTGIVLLGAGYAAGSVLSRPQTQGDNPKTIIKEWRGSAAGTIIAISETSIIIEKDGAQVVVGITQETEIAKSVIDAEGVEQLTPLTLQNLQKGTKASIAVVLTSGRLQAEAIRVIEATQ